MRNSAESKSSLQSKPISKTARTEEDLIRRLAIIEQILERLHMDLRIQPLDQLLLTKTAGSWNVHFDREGIPTNRLLEVYFEAMANREEATWFSPTTMIRTWRDMVAKEAVESRTRELDSDDCPLCKGKGTIMDFDKEIPCPYKHPVRS